MKPAMVDVGGRDGAFHVNGLSDPTSRYRTRVAAFEAAVAAASTAFAEGRSVVIRVCGGSGRGSAPDDRRPA